MLKRLGESRHPCRTSTVVRKPVSYAAVKDDCTSGLVMEVFDDSDKVSADVVLLHGCSQSGMPTPALDRLEVYKDMVEVLFVLKIFFTEDS